MKIGLIKLVHEDLHPAPPGHPENSLRMSGALKVIENSDIAGEIEILTPGDADIGALFHIHEKRYVDGVRECAENGGGYLDADTYVGKRSFAAAMKMISATVWAGDSIVDGSYERIFVAGRPPGHHAERSMGMGFCIFNNIAVAAEHLVRNRGLSRVAIIDWDVHHGNGTQNAFYGRNDVMFVSLHQSPLYPGTGRASETGEGAGTGYTLNIPMVPGSGDNEYAEAFEKKLIPALEEFGPEMILISAGFDARNEDPLASINLTENAYSFMTRNLVDLAERNCSGRILSLFEGGYDPRANAESLYAHLKELIRE